MIKLDRDQKIAIIAITTGIILIAFCLLIASAFPDDEIQQRIMDGLNNGLNVVGLGK